MFKFVSSIEQFRHAIKHLFMKSTIRIGRDLRDIPCIKISCVDNNVSDDLRDETLRMFVKLCSVAPDKHLGLCVLYPYVHSTRADGIKCFNADIIPLNKDYPKEQIITIISYLQKLL